MIEAGIKNGSYIGMKPVTDDNGNIVDYEPIANPALNNRFTIPGKNKSGGATDKSISIVQFLFNAVFFIILINVTLFSGMNFYGILSFIKGGTEQSGIIPPVNNMGPDVESTKDNISFRPLAEPNISNIVENLNVNDNDKIKEGLKQGLDMITHLNV